MLVLEFRVRAEGSRLGPGLDSWDTKRLGTKRLGYEMPGSLGELGFVGLGSGS